MLDAPPRDSSRISEAGMAHSGVNAPEAGAETAESRGAKRMDRMVESSLGKTLSGAALFGVSLDVAPGIAVVADDGAGGAGCTGSDDVPGATRGSATVFGCGAGVSFARSAGAIAIASANAAPICEVNFHDLIVASSILPTTIESQRSARASRATFHTARRATRPVRRSTTWATRNLGTLQGRTVQYLRQTGAASECGAN